MARKKLAAEISGKVWKIEAAPGAALQTDDPVLILESMKMEIPVSAPGPCTLVEILVHEGDTVSEGQTLAVIEA